MELLDSIPTRCDIPTGLGKTSIIAIWLLARQVNSSLPRRLVYVVNRRTVVDQTTNEVERIRENLSGNRQVKRLIYRSARSAASSPTIVNGPPTPRVKPSSVARWTWIGSRLLFSGYGVGFKEKPLHAGFLRQDTLIVHDEAASRTGVSKAPHRD